MVLQEPCGIAVLRPTPAYGPGVQDDVPPAASRGSRASQSQQGAGATPGDVHPAPTGGDPGPSETAPAVDEPRAPNPGTDLGAESDAERGVGTRRRLVSRLRDATTDRRIAVAGTVATLLGTFVAILAWLAPVHVTQSDEERRAEYVAAADAACAPHLNTVKAIMSAVDATAIDKVDGLLGSKPQAQRNDLVDSLQSLRKGSPESEKVRLERDTRMREISRLIADIDRQLGVIRKTADDLRRSSVELSAMLTDWAAVPPAPRDRPEVEAILAAYKSSPLRFQQAAQQTAELRSDEALRTITTWESEWDAARRKSRDFGFRTC